MTPRTARPLVAAALLAALGAPASAAPVRVDASIVAQAYTWTVENVSAAPITSFEVPQHNVYYGDVPPGWTLEITDDRFRAVASTAGAAIRPGAAADFVATVASSGAVPGRVMATVGTDGAPILVAVPLAPRRNPLAAVLAVAGLLVAIGLAHVALTRRA